MPALAQDAADHAARSFRVLFESELPYVVRTLQRLGVRDADVEDLAQEVFVAVHRRLDEYDRTRPVRPWLFAFCWRVTGNYRRLARHATRLDGARIEARPGDGTDDPHESAVRSQRRRLLLRALEAVPFDRRCVLVMHDLDGMAAPVISATLDVPLNTVYSRLRVARRELAGAVAAIGGEMP